jgi:hypothetical protein
MVDKDRSRGETGSWFLVGTSSPFRIAGGPRILLLPSLVGSFEVTRLGLAVWDPPLPVGAEFSMEHEVRPAWVRETVFVAEGPPSERRGNAGKGKTSRYRESVGHGVYLAGKSGANFLMNQVERGVMDWRRLFGCHFGNSGEDEHSL